MHRLFKNMGVAVLILSFAGCGSNSESSALLNKYTTVRLTSDISHLSQNQARMIPLLIDAAREMDDAFWLQAYGHKESLLAGITDENLRKFAAINYGPWDRLDGNKPFIVGVGEKAHGANLYPADMTADEFNELAAKNPELGEQLKSLYTIVGRDDGGALVPMPYNEFFADQYKTAADKLRAAAELAEDPGFKKYLTMRADALLSNDYRASDMAWMDMKDNMIDIVIGPIETYEDQLFGYKAANEGYVLIKDMAWSERLAKYAAMLPQLQRGLPVPDAYKQDKPGRDSDLNVYDVIYYAGDCNAGSKTIAINLPNDEVVQLAKGTRRLQLKNAMEAKFEKILLPISEQLVSPDQRQHIKFESFFNNTMFHEVAHGLGIKNTIDGTRTVREAMLNRASALEEGKADVLGLYMIISLVNSGALENVDLMDNYVTFFTSIFRSIRFGAASAHGIANLIRFNFFKELGAFSRDEATGQYTVDGERMLTASDELAGVILKFQGDGDYEGVSAFVDKYAVISTELQGDLDRLAEAKIPVDIVFEQGIEFLE